MENAVSFGLCPSVGIKKNRERKKRLSVPETYTNVLLLSTFPVFLSFQCNWSILMTGVDSNVAVDNKTPVVSSGQLTVAIKFSPDSCGYDTDLYSVSTIMLRFYRTERWRNIFLKKPFSMAYRIAASVF